MSVIKCGTQKYLVKLLNADGKEFSLKRYIFALCKGQDLENLSQDNPSIFESWVKQSIVGRISRVAVVLRRVD